MPRRKRTGEWAVLYAELPPALKAWLDAQAEANRRSVTAELTVLLEAALDPKYRPAADAGGKPPPPKASRRKGGA